MGAFTSFQNILPDPNNPIGSAGQADSTNGLVGPGFASVKLSSDQPYVTDKTNSGRILARAIASHKWKVNITYNPMTREQFDPVYTFLIQRKGPMFPFYVSLPQYRTPKDPDFATYIASNNFLEVNGAVAAGSTTMTLDRSNYTIGSNSTPSPGDLFKVSGTNSNHEKIYMVTRVETPTDYLQSSGAPSSNNVRIHFVPGLSKAVSNNDDVVFGTGAHMKVMRVGRVEEYSLNSNNLYSFSLNLEEVQ